MRVRPIDAYLRIFGSCKRAKPMSISVQAYQSFVQILTAYLAPLVTLSPRKLRARLQSFSLREQILQKQMGS